MRILKYSDDYEWGYTLYSMAASVKLEVEQAMNQATHQEEQEELETIYGGNIGCALLYVDGGQKEYWAYSGIQRPADRVTLTRDFVYLKQERLFLTLSVDNENNLADPPTGFDRYFDTESKILEQVAEELGDRSDVVGELFLFTERYPCTSCIFVIEQFQKRYAGIQVVVYYEKNTRRRRSAQYGVQH